MAGCWAWDFYEIRSRIVHGDLVPARDLIYKDWLTHLIVADLVFRECIMRNLWSQGLIGENIHFRAKELYKENRVDPVNKIEEVLMRWFFRFNSVHEALIWIPSNDD
jgi:hypothetical protein